MGSSRKGRGFVSIRAVIATVLVVFSFTLTGCGSSRGNRVYAVKEIHSEKASPVIAKEEVAVAPALAKEKPDKDYRVGVTDVLYVNVYGYPDLGSPAGTLGAKLQGSRVDGDGYIHLPMVGSVKVAGLTVGQIQKRLQKAFRNFIKKPWVVVEVVEFRSKPLYLLGQFNMPGTVYMDRPLTILQGIALGKGFTDAASLHGARLLRNDRIVPVDIYEILTEGKMEQNVWLKPKDTLYIPDARSQKIFVFGEVEKPGPIPMVSGEMSLVEALATAGIGNKTYDHRIRIIRSLSTTKGELIVIDLDKVLNGNALPFPLREGDIVYVPRSGIGSWNQAIRELLPTLQLVSGVLEPFVQIKFLRD